MQYDPGEGRYRLVETLREYASDSQFQNGADINTLDRQGSATMNLTITGNAISHPGTVLNGTNAIS